MKRITNETRLQDVRANIVELDKAYCSNFMQFTESMQEKIRERLKELRQEEVNLKGKLGYKG